MIVLRFIGSLFLLAAVIALTADLSRARQPQTPAFLSLYQHWSDYAPQTLKTVQQAVETSVHPLLWDPILSGILAVPAWMTFGALALLCLYLGRPRRRVDIFIN